MSHIWTGRLVHRQTDGATDALLDFSKPVLSELVLVGEEVRRERKGDNINYKEVVKRNA